jgi:hypothetical protein
MALFSCGNSGNDLSVTNSGSFSDKAITLSPLVINRLLPDSIQPVETSDFPENNLLQAIETLTRGLENIQVTKSDTMWTAFKGKWENFRKDHIGSDGLPIISGELPDSLKKEEIERIAPKWVDLNAKLLKYSGEVKFGDAIEKLLYEGSCPIASEGFLKSIIYTHTDDQIYINIFGSSSVTHHHTTGGVVTLIQETDYPASQKIILRCECTDTRFLDVFIRIPEWAVNPTVGHGNVKYVAYPGQYSEIMRKWKDGDEIQISFNN